MDYQSYLSPDVAVNLKNSDFKGIVLMYYQNKLSVSKSMLAQIEKGTANPSLGVLERSQAD